MRMVTGRVAPAFSGMIAGIASSTLQVSTALSVAVIGGIFYTVLGARTDPAAIIQAFIVAILCIAACLAVGAGLSITVARRLAPLPRKEDADRPCGRHRLDGRQPDCIGAPRPCEPTRHACGGRSVVTRCALVQRAVRFGAIRTICRSVPGGPLVTLAV